MAKVCVSGYYGYGSIGDELMLKSMVNALRRQDEEIDIVVISASPEETAAEYGVRAVGREKWEEIRLELKTSDFLISGGGYLLKETNDLADLKYYLKVIKTAQHQDIPVFVYNQILRPFHSSRTKATVSRIMKKIRKISVADSESAEVLQDMDIRRGRIHIVEDPVLTLTEFDPEWNLSEIGEAGRKIVPVSSGKAVSAEPVPAAAEMPKSEAAPAEEVLPEEEKPEIVYADDAELEIEIRIIEEESAPACEETPAAEAETGAEEAAVDGEPVISEEMTEEIPAEEAPAPETEEVPAEETPVEDTVPVEAAEEPAAPAEEIAVPPCQVKKAPHVPKRPVNLGTVVPSFWKNPGERFAAFVIAPGEYLPVSQITAMADYMIDNGYQVVFLPVSCGDAIKLNKEILASMKNPAFEVDGKMSPVSFLTAIDAVDFVFSADFYSMAAAAVCKKPLASLCCTRREVDFITELGLIPTGNMLEYDGEQFIENFKAVVADPAAVVAGMEEALPGLLEKAEEGWDQFRMLFAQIERKKRRAERAAEAGSARRSSPADTAVKAESANPAPADADAAGEVAEAAEAAEFAGAEEAVPGEDIEALMQDDIPAEGKKKINFSADTVKSFFAKLLAKIKSFIESAKTRKTGDRDDDEYAGYDQMDSEEPAEETADVSGEEFPAEDAGAEVKE